MSIISVTFATADATAVVLPVFPAFIETTCVPVPFLGDTVVFVTTSSVIVCRYCNVATVFALSVVAINFPAGLTRVPRSSSPTRPVLAGTIIGRTSLYCPVLIVTVHAGLFSTGIPVLTPAASAVVTIEANEVIVAITPASASTPVVYCNTGLLTPFST